MTKTVFVVGAGASQELDLPIGEGLKPKISDALKRDPQSVTHLFADQQVDTAVQAYAMREPHNQFYEAIHRYRDAADALDDALPFALSIDQYIDSQRGNKPLVQLAKLGIVAAILKAERESKIGPLGTPRDARLSKAHRFSHSMERTWHLKLVQLLTANCPVERLPHVFDDVGFIVFNYDRCLEQYLAAALTRYYAKSDQVIPTLRSLKIVHPYGQVGGLHWQDEPHINYGEQPAGDMDVIADDILTFTESAKSGMIQEVRKLMQNATTVIFLGFGFLPQNVELITPEYPTSVERVFYTTKGVSRSDVTLVNAHLKSIFGKGFNSEMVKGYDEGFDAFEDEGRCIDLMDNHWMRLRAILQRP